MTLTNSFIQVPSDGGGKKLRSRISTVGSNDVHEQYMIALESDRLVSGRWYGDPGVMVVGASADAATVGRWYLFNQVGSTTLVAVRRVEFASQHGSALVTATSPRFGLRTFTFTGTATGTAIVAAKQDTSSGSPAALFSLAKTGATLTDVAVAKTFLPVTALTAVGASPPNQEQWVPSATFPLYLRAGEGICLTQLDAGTASDTRRVVTAIAWDEFTLPT
jgi:hypothetical protein